MAASMSAALWGSLSRIQRGLTATSSVLSQSGVHTSAALERRNWEMKNKVVYPPQLPDEPRRPAEIHHCRRLIKYSMDKMWYLATLILSLTVEVTYDKNYRPLHSLQIKGMSIDRAIAQMEFSDKKGAKVIKEVLLEAQEMAVRNHHVEYKSNLYVADSFSGKGTYLKRIRIHGRGKFGIMDKVHCHYFVKLVEGPPPPKEKPITGFQQAEDYVQQLRNRTIIHSL